MSILIVEDNVVNQKVLIRALERGGLSDLHVHGSAEAALNEIATTTFDLILTDWMLPGLSGVEFVRSVRRSWSNATTPVLMVTSRNHTDYVIEALEAGANGYILKPFEATVLLEKVRTLIAAHEAARWA